MVCGRCHRESEDHPLSSSGPTRCEYPTHREDCPGGFKTACDMSANEKKETASKTDFIEQNDAMKTIEQALLHLNLHASLNLILSLIPMEGNKILCCVLASLLANSSNWQTASTWYKKA